MRLKKYTEIMVPRGFGKTTLVSIVLPVFEIVYQDVDFTACISEAAPHAKMQLDNIKRELTTNALILAVFGNLKPKLTDDERWGQEMFETKSGMVMVARGQGGQVRGLNHRGRRPKKIIVDDLEDKESVSTQAQREKVRTWFYGDLKPALPKMDPDATIVVLGTLLHQDALLETLARDPEWTTVRLSALDIQNAPIWPEMYTVEELQKLKQSYLMAGLLHVYYLEYMNEAKSPETQVFIPEFFIFNPVPEGSDLLTAVYMDPAISKRRTADDTVIIGGGINDRNGCIYVTHVWGKLGASEDEKVTQFFKIQKELGSRRNGIESVSYQAALLETFHTEMFRRKQYFEIEGVPHKTKKTERIRGVLRTPFFNGRIIFTRHFPELEAQLLDFRQDLDDQPDDYPDALAGMVKLLDPHAAAAAGEQDLAEDEYEDWEDGDCEWAS